MRREKYFKVKNNIESVMPQVTTMTKTYFKLIGIINEISFFQ